MDNVPSPAVEIPLAAMANIWYQREKGNKDCWMFLDVFLMIINVTEIAYLCQ